MPAYLSDASQNYNQIRRLHQRVPNVDPIQKLEYYLSASDSAGSAAGRAGERARRASHGRACVGVRSGPAAGAAVAHVGQQQQLRPATSGSGSLASSRASASGSSSYSSKLMNLIRSRWRNQMSRDDDDDDGDEQEDGEEGDDQDRDYDQDYGGRRGGGSGSGASRRDFVRGARGPPPPSPSNGHPLSPFSSPLESSGFSEGTLVGPAALLPSGQLARQCGPPRALKPLGLGRVNPRALRAAEEHGGGSSALDDFEAPAWDLYERERVARKGRHQLQVADFYGAQRGNVRQVRLADVAPPPPLGAARSRRRKITRINRRNLGRVNDQWAAGGPLAAASSFDVANYGGASGAGGRYASSAYALSELFSQSEIPGFREIFASDSYLRKFCWIVAFLFMTVLSLNDMTALITEYYEYPITVDVRLRDSARLPFPAVTVCNLNAVRFSALCSSSRFELASQIPPDLRDKLCGLQVEKKKKKPGGAGGSGLGGSGGAGNSGDDDHSAGTTNSDSDIGDINNIGITTTTTTTTSATTTTTGAGATAGTGSSSSTPASTSAAATPSAAASATTTPASTTASSLAGGGLGASANASSAPGWARAPTVSLRHAVSGGSGAATEIGRAGGAPGRTRRSHQLASGGAGGEPLRPFAPKKWSLRLPAAGVPPGEPTKRPAPGQLEPSQAPEHRNKASQFNGPKLSNLQLGGRPLATSESRPGQPTNQMGGGGGGGRNQFAQGGNQPGPLSPTSPMQPPVPPLPSLMSPGGPLGANPNRNQQQQQQPLNPAAGADFVPFVEPAEDFELTERQEREVQENLTNWLAVMYQRDAALTRSLGHQFDDMILRCTMKSINCTRQRSFENSFSPTEGNCFTFSSRVKRKLATANGQMTILWDTYEEANLAGTSDGLELVLNLEKNEYIAGSSQVGALVMIHHPSELGYAASEATFVAPEFTTYIGLKMVNVTRLPAPFPEYCVDSWPAKFADTLTRNSTYSQQACLQICLQKTIQTQCNCQSAFLPIVELDSAQLAQQQQGPSSSPPPPPLPPLDGHPLGPHHDANLADAGEHSGGGGDPGALPTSLPADLVANLSAAAAAPPSASFLLAAGRHARATAAASANNATATPAIQRPQPPPQPQQRIIICDTRKRATRQCVREVNLRAADRVHDCECPPKCRVIRYDKTISMARWPTREDKVSFDRGKLDVNFQNLAKVIVYFQTMTCEEVQQQAVFNAAKLFSALGGIMGMYVGFSFLSVFEIFEVMSRKFWHYLRMRFLRTSSFSLTAATAATAAAAAASAVDKGSA